MKLEQVSIQGDHVHLLVRAPRRSQFHYFFRVVAGQIAQQFEKDGKLLGTMVTDTPSTINPKPKPTQNSGSGKGQKLKRRKGVGLWKHRPFSRVVKGWRAYQIVRNYIQLNEKEALGQIVYRNERLRGLSMSEWQSLWS